MFSSITCRNKKEDDYFPNYWRKVIVKSNLSMAKDRDKDVQYIEKSKLELM